MVCYHLYRFWFLKISNYFLNSTSPQSFFQFSKTKTRQFYKPCGWTFATHTCTCASAMCLTRTTVDFKDKSALSYDSPSTQTALQSTMKQSTVADNLTEPTSSFSSRKVNSEFLTVLIKPNEYLNGPLSRGEYDRNTLIWLVTKKSERICVNNMVTLGNRYAFCLASTKYSVIPDGLNKRGSINLLEGDCTVSEMIMVDKMVQDHLGSYFW